MFAKYSHNSGKNLLSAAILAAVVMISPPQAGAHETAKSDTPVAVSRSTSLITADIDRSVAFYTNFFGYTVVNRAPVPSKSVRESMGLYAEGDVEFVVLAAPNRSEGNKAFSGINLIGGNAVSVSPFTQDKTRPSPAGQLLFSFQVKGLDEIEKRMRAAGVVFISRPALSSTGKSKTMSVFDPNGIRVDLYEYIPQK